ncbi:MAG TPA: ATP-binding protein, partial [Pseudomonadales bacterium]|nr:ATP-binding protein [Pseudomonadales bacterium]
VNLFKNAVEALEGIDAPRIEVSTQGAVNVDGKHYLEIVVSDNGRGMSPEQRLNLFSGETSTKGEGRGLGLGIVKNLLAEMSAMIACRENTGGGTSFQVLVPLG